MHHCYIGLPLRRIPPCHNARHLCFFGAICGTGPITTLTHPSTRTGAIKPRQPVMSNVDAVFLVSFFSFLVNELAA
jgi:hypothetical protein